MAAVVALVKRGGPLAGLRSDAYFNRAQCFGRSVRVYGHV